MKVLLLGFLLFNLNNALGIQQNVEKNETQFAQKEQIPEFLWKVPPQYQYGNKSFENNYESHNNYDNYSNSHNTTTSAPYKDSDVIEFSPDTENYNNAAPTLDELLHGSYKSASNSSSEQSPDTELKPDTNTDSSADHFYSKLTSDVPDEFPWEFPLSIEKKEIGPTDLIEESEPPFATTAADIVNYNKETLPKCPNGFTYYDKILEESVCHHVTQPASFPPSCPYPSTVGYPWDLPTTNHSVWVLTKRNTTDISDVCFVKRGSTIIPRNCTDKYPTICIYKYLTSGYCTRRFNTTCIDASPDSPSTCYCLSFAQMDHQSRNTFCKKLVENPNPFENNLLLRLSYNTKPCWIGLNKNRWSSSNSTSSYGFWSNRTDFSKPYGVLGGESWYLQEDGVLNCAICEIEIEEYPKVQLHIQYNKTTNMLEVNITNSIEILDYVTCFARNSNNYELVDIRFNSTNPVVINMEFPFTTTDYYWCTALQIPNLTTVYSNRILIRGTSGHEYALSVTYLKPSSDSPEATDVLTCDTIKYNLPLLRTSRLIKIIKNNQQKEAVEVLCHINTHPSRLTITKEFKIISNLLSNSSAKITNLASIEVCLPSITISGSRKLYWPETPVGVTTIPEELCLQEDGSPVTRTCTGDFEYGSRWLDVNGTCANITYSERTHLLDDLLKSDTTAPSNLSRDLLTITEDTNNFSSFEIHLVSKALQKLVAFSENISVTNIVQTINNIMHFEPSKLRRAQKVLNSTDMLLCSLDEMLALTKTDDSGYTSAVTEKLLVQISDLKKTNIIGIQLGSSETQHGFDPTKINPLHQGTLQEDLMKENLDLAMLIPQQLHDDIVNCVGPELPPNLITTVFYDDALFNEDNSTTHQTDGRIISVTIPNFDCSFTAPFQIIFKPSPSNNTHFKCASWDYGFNDVRESTHGQWLSEGEPKTFGNSTYQVCEFSHVTHFTLLVLSGSNDISEGHKKALDIITAVGSVLSILGLLMVFVTAIVFKSFRSANAVVINFSVAMTAQIVLLFAADNVAGNKVLCTVFGAALHYIVLSQFCWMLTIAILQYRRYVIIFSRPTTHLVVKTCACSWGIPLIPIIIIISISRDNYGENSYGLCYALGNYFIFGVLIPVSLIIFINLLVFLRIMLSIASSRGIKSHQKKDDTSSLQLRLAIMLYFLLGMTWGFGLLAAIGGGIAYSYLFCLTATLQGFILFLYFIVLNEKTRSLWVNMKTCCCKSKSEDYNVNTDSAGTAMMRRPRNAKNSDTNTSSTTSEMLRRYKNRSSSDF